MVFRVWSRDDTKVFLTEFPKKFGTFLCSLVLWNIAIPILHNVVAAHTSSGVEDDETGQRIMFMRLESLDKSATQRSYTGQQE